MVEISQEILPVARERVLHEIFDLIPVGFLLVGLIITVIRGSVWAFLGALMVTIIFRAYASLGCPPLPCPNES